MPTPPHRCGIPLERLLRRRYYNNHRKALGRFWGTGTVPLRNQVHYIFLNLRVSHEIT
jgi:hypothetical protein